MSERTCPRCHNLLNVENSGMLLYCSHCGAPQVLLSEELREQTAERDVAHIAAQDGTTPTGNFAEAGLTSLDTSDPMAIDWTEAVRVAGLGGLISLGLGLLAMPVPPLSFLELLWALIAPIVILGIYCSRRRHTRISAGFGARLGLVTGLAIAAAMFTVDALQLIADRFILHRGVLIDTALMTVFTKLQESHAASQQPMPINIAIPEFRVGMLLFSIGFGICLYLIYTVISGAFGGLMRSRSRVVQ